jgi:DNA-binding GntR family transcriptional regulator
MVDDVMNRVMRDSRPAAREWTRGPQCDPRAPLAASLAAVLRERILTGAYVPAERLREVALQHEFSVSNGPIREALHLLAAEGLVMRQERRGVCVIDLSSTELVNLFEIRIGLLELAAELAARRTGAGFATQIEPIMTEMHQATARGDVEAHLGIGFAFTCAVCEAAGNLDLLETWKKLMMRLRLAIYRSLTQTDVAAVVRIADELAAAIIAADVSAARIAARRLVRRHMQDLGLGTVLA